MILMIATYSMYIITLTFMNEYCNKPFERKLNLQIGGN